jgi:hypothetical protein
MTTRVKKRCRKCGAVAVVPTGRRRCYQRKFGKGSYACWGELTRVTRPAKPLITVPPGMGLGWVLGEEADRAMSAAYRAKAERQLKLARQKVTEVTRKIARATTSLRMWERRAAYYAQRASLTDAELAQEKADRKSKAEARAQSRVKRGMKLEKAV